MTLTKQQNVEFVKISLKAIKESETMTILVENKGVVLIKNGIVCFENQNMYPLFFIIFVVTIHICF